MLKELLKTEKKRPQLKTRKLQMGMLNRKGKHKGRKSSTHKYYIKTSNHEKRGVQIQDTGNAFVEIGRAHV